jgi:hypothetical protein
VFSGVQVRQQSPPQQVLPLGQSLSMVQRSVHMFCAEISAHARPAAQLL